MKKFGTKTTLLAVSIACLVALGGCSKGEKTQTVTSTPTVEPTITAEVTEEVKEEDKKEEVESGKNFAGLEFDHTADLRYAKGFTLDYYKEGYKVITVESNHPGMKFLVVPEGKEAPQGLDDTTVILQQPINKVTFNSTSAMSLMDAMNGLDRVASVGTDVNGWYIETIKKKMEEGSIVFSGKYSAPDFELLTKNGSQLVVDTTMINSHPEIPEKYKELGIPLIVEDSSKESTPLGRVEWVKLYAAILGMEEEADAYFNKEEAVVNEVANSEKTGKTVLMFFGSSEPGKYYVRNGGDYMATMIGLAGGDYIMADLKPDNGGTTVLNPEEMYAKGKDVDYIIYINYGGMFQTMQQFVDSNELFADYKAVKDGNVFITAPDYTQSMAKISNIISDFHKIFVNADDATTTMVTKLK